MAFEALAQLEDHKVYSAGSAEEALHQIEVYVPEVVIIATDPPDKSALELVQSLRASERALLRAMPIATPVGAAAQAAQPNSIWARGTAPDTLLAAALDAIQTAVEPAAVKSIPEETPTEEPTSV